MLPNQVTQSVLHLEEISVHTATDLAEGDLLCGRGVVVVAT